MWSYTQAGRLLKVTTPLGPDAMLLVGLRGREALSEPFRFELDLVAWRHLPLDFHALLGKPVAVDLTLPNGTARSFHGIVTRLTQGRQDEEFAHYQAVLSPRFWLWKRRIQSRIFQQKSVPEILDRVLNHPPGAEEDGASASAEGDGATPSGGLNARFELQGHYEARNYCVQYRESDFDFACRLMEEEGIYYYFEHSAEGHQLVLADDSTQAADVPLPASVAYDDLDQGVRDTCRVRAWQKSQQVRSTKFTLWDRSFELPGQNLAAGQALPESVEVGQVEHQLACVDEPLEAYDYPGAYAKRFDGVGPGGNEQPEELTKVFDDAERTVALDAQRETAAAIDLAARSDCAHFVPGLLFELTRHGLAGGKYLLSVLEHEARQEASFRSDGDLSPLSYENRLACLPAKVHYRPPRRTPKPVIAGLQSATVVGPENESIFVDKYGRVKVQFPWDRQGEHNADSSCWLRVAQPWAGPRFGAFFWPRIGHEVLVAFFEGDPDRPIVVGSVYNAANMPPLELPEGKSSCGLKSCSIDGDPLQNANCVVLHDRQDDEHLQLHSETHECITAETSNFHHTPGPQVHVVGKFPFSSGSGGGGGEPAGPPVKGAGTFSGRSRSRASGGTGPTRHAPGAFRRPWRVDPAGPGALARPSLILPGRDSGQGGGMIEWVECLNTFTKGQNTGAAHGIEAAAKWLEGLLPGAASWVFGSNLKATFLGDKMAHVIGFGNIGITCDLEALTIGRILEKIPVLGSLLSGAGGKTDFIWAPEQKLSYDCDKLDVRRGTVVANKEANFWKDWSLWGVAVKAMILLVAGAATAGDLMAGINAQAKAKKEPEPYPEWTTQLATFFANRLLGLLAEFEKHLAEVKHAKAEADETEKYTAEAAKLTELAGMGLAGALGPTPNLVSVGTKKGTDAIKLITGVFDDGTVHTCADTTYALRAGKRISIVAKPTKLGVPPGGKPTVTLLAGDLWTKGHLNLWGTERVDLSAGISDVYVRASKSELGGELNLANTKMGKVTVNQGQIPGSPKATFSTEGIPQIELTLGVAPATEGTITMKDADVEIKAGPEAKVSVNAVAVEASFAESSVKVDATGVTAQAGPAQVKVMPAEISLSLGPNSISISPEGVTITGADVSIEGAEQSMMQGGTGMVVCTPSGTTINSPTINMM